MGRDLLASAGFAIAMELVVVPCFNYLSMESRWSISTFVGALLFLAACANLLYCVDLWQWLKSVIRTAPRAYSAAFCVYSVVYVCVC